MYTKILVPLDGSPLSEGVLPYARFFAKQLKVPVELLQVIEPHTVSIFSDPEHGRYVDVVEAALKSSSRDYLDPVAGSFPEPSAVDCSVKIGDPAEVIVDEGSAQAGALIAMATHGYSGIRRWLMGSVAEKILRATTNHLLIVRPTGQTGTSGVAGLESVLVPLDGSPLAEKVFPLVAILARKMNLEVVLLRVYAPLRAAYVADEYMPDLTRISKEIRGEAQSYLEQRVQQLQGEGLERVSSLLLEGDGAGEIVDMARRTRGSLVAMCTHGRSGIGRWVLGSVTERVVRHSADPVLVVRPSAPGSR